MLTLTRGEPEPEPHTTLSTMSPPASDAEYNTCIVEGTDLAKSDFEIATPSGSVLLPVYEACLIIVQVLAGFHATKSSAWNSSIASLESYFERSSPPFRLPY